MLKLVRYEEDYYDRWNKFIDDSCNGTLFHRMDFLLYHGDKFKDNEHSLIWLKGEQIFAVMPFATFEENGTLIGKSPYGASFGGIVVRKSQKLKYSEAIIKALNEYLDHAGIHKVFINMPPHYYYNRPSKNLEFSLGKAKFELLSRDLFNVIDISHKNIEQLWKNYEGRVRTAIRKAGAEFDLSEDVSIEEFYPILLEDKNRHNNALPTHTIEELIFIKRTFPTRVFCDVATHKDTGAKAGICYFYVNRNVVLTFYMAQQTAALKLNGVTLLVDQCIKRAISEGFKFFDFGGSTVGYTIQNLGVSDFKEGFGATGFVRETYSKEYIV